MNKKSGFKNALLIEGIILSLVSAFFIKESIKLHNNGSWALSPALFPLIVTSITFLLAINLIVKGIKNPENQEREEIYNRKNLFLVIIASIIYYIILPKIGFVPASVLYLLSFLLILGEKKWWLIAIISIVTPLLIDYLFGNLLGVLLP